MKMKTIIRTIFSVLLSLGMLFLLPISARANGGIISDWLRIYNPSGIVAYEVSVTESQEENNPNEVYYINTGNLVLVDINMYRKPTALLETSGPLQGQYSDLIGIGAFGPVGNKQFYLAFTSDTELSQASGDPYKLAPYKYNETHPVWNVTMYLHPDLQAARWKAEFYSDLEAPLPGTLLLFGSGLAGLAVMRRKFLG
jgi:hypothetical protein